MDLALTVDVVDRRMLVPGSVVELTLASGPGQPLPPWEAGAHVDLILPSGLTRQYSLCGDPAERTAYRIAVLRAPDSRGGSVEVHDALSTGSSLMIRGPRNHFPLQPAPHNVLLAGGIGITPLLPMIRRLQQDGTSWELFYGGRSQSSMAYVEDLTQMAPDTVHVFPEDVRGWLPLEAVFRDAPSGCAVYACGPAAMLSAVLARSVARPDIDLHIERFGPSAPPAAQPQEDSSFSVTLQRSARTLPVPAGTRLIDVVRQVVPTVPFSCEEGYCGSCETAVLDGEPDHRDTILSEQERQANDCMMICVGRSRSPVLVLDL